MRYWSCIALWVTAAVFSAPLGTVFTYQGELLQSGQPAHGSFDFQVELYNVATGGSQIDTVLVEDVAVDQGAFTLELDFTSVPFEATESYWLEFSVRDGASTGGYTSLLPRTRITAAPYALNALTVAAQSIDSQAIVQAEVQRRVSSSCAAGQSIRSIAADGSVVCEFDDDTDTTYDGSDFAVSGQGCSVGQVVTAIAADGTVVCTADADTTYDGTDFAISGQGCGAGEVITELAADGSVVCAPDANTTYMGTCPDGQAILAINANGSVSCGFTGAFIPRRPTFILTLNSASSSARPGVAIGADGLPVISFMQNSNLLVAKCNDPACSGGDETITTVDNPTNLLGFHTDIAIGPDTFPVISYQDFTDRALKVAKCNDPACTGGDEAMTVVDNDANDLAGTQSITIGSDGLPIVAYHDFTTGTLKVAKCNDPDCSSAAINNLDAQNSFQPSIAIGTDGFPVIAYWRSSNFVRVTKCDDLACAPGGEVQTTIDGLPANSVGPSPSLAIGADGFPVISYFNITDLALRVAKCSDAACAGAVTLTNVDDPANDVGRSSSLAIGPDGLPIISYEDTSATALKVARCNDPACSGGGETMTTVDGATANVGSKTRIAIGMDGLPIVVYTDSDASALKFAKCGSLACTP